MREARTVTASGVPKETRLCLATESGEPVIIKRWRATPGDLKSLDHTIFELMRERQWLAAELERNS